MKTKMKFGLILLSVSMYVAVRAQDIPLVFDVENRGDSFVKPVLPAIENLPVVEPLTDPFEWSDGSGRDTTIESWSKRRNEIKAEIENYEIGFRPTRPDTITASYTSGKLTVNVTENGQTITLTSTITLPSGDGPFPAIIGMNSGTGSLPSDIFSSRKIATIAFYHDQVTSYSGKKTSDPFFKLYPNLFYIGQYSAWSWGVSRIIDGLELVKDVLPIDLSHLAVTGCSYAGKMALFSGAFDERIALTIAQESGGGGAAAWRVSQGLGAVETLGSTNKEWFTGAMFKFASAVTKLPHDHHELMAMVAPRALLVLGNPDYIWLADESGYVSSRATQKIYETLGIGDRYGFSYVAGHNHCSLPSSQRPEVEGFVDKFLLGDTTANTNYSISPFENVDYMAWTNWWGSGDPVFPQRDTINSESIWLEAECTVVGNKWLIKKSTVASNLAYATITPGLNSTSVAPDDSTSTINFSFTTKKDTTYYIFARIYAKDNNDDSFWVKIDDGDFVNYSGLVSTTWRWLKITTKELKAGDHTITFAYSEDGASLDKLCITSNKLAPLGKGDTASNLCVPVYSPKPSNITNIENGYGLGQNYPNPFNGKTSIAFEIPNETFVSLKIYNVFGIEIEELAGVKYPSGKHTVDFDAKALPKGIYFYTLKTNNYISNKKMILQNN